MRGKKGLDYYQVLEVDYDASFEEIKASYRQLIQQYRDDNARLNLVTQAWNVLSDPSMKKKYDRKINVAARRLHRRRGRAAASQSRVAKTEVFDRGGRTFEQPPGDTGIVAPVRTQEFVRIPRTQIIDADEGATLHVPSHRTEIIQTDGTSHPQPDLGPDADVGETRIRDEEETRVHATTFVPSAFLEVFFPDGRRKEYALKPDKATIGRKSNNDIVLEDLQMYISRQHAYVIFKDGEYYIVDNDSRNGTRVEGKEIRAKGEVLLTEGDTIEIEGWKLTFHLKSRS